MREDSISKYRETVDGWHDKSVSGELLVLNELPGKLAMLQGFRGTACRVLERELLRRVLAGTRSALAESISARRQALAADLEKAIRELHWKDFETLVDLVFRRGASRETTKANRERLAIETLVVEALEPPNCPSKRILYFEELASPDRQSSTRCDLPLIHADSPGLIRVLSHRSHEAFCDMVRVL